MTALEKKLLEENEQLREQLDAAIKEISILKALVAEMSEKLNQNSQNSSKPPSSDGYKKPAPKSLRKHTGKQAGGQNGHPGKTLTINREPDERIRHMPCGCEGCVNYERCMKYAQSEEKRYVVDAIMRVNITAHEILAVKCPLCGEMKKAEFPEDIKAYVQYGENLKALVIALNTIGTVSVNRVHKILGSVFDIPLSVGTISNMVSNFADQVYQESHAIRRRISKSDVVHFDETGIRINGKLNWVHVASTADDTYLYLGPQRGQKGMDTGKVLPVFDGIAVHDCWAPYWRYDTEHAVCCAHLLRELQGATENHPEQTWASLFSDFLLEMKHFRDAAVEKGLHALSKHRLRCFRKQYDAILKIAREENPLPEQPEGKRGRRKKGKMLSLIDRLDKYREEICLFTKNFAVPFDNNQAERDLRMIKVKTKVSGGFRSVEGTDGFLRILSYLDTANKQEISLFDAIRRVFRHACFLCSIFIVQFRGLNSYSKISIMCDLSPSNPPNLLSGIQIRRIRRKEDQGHLVPNILIFR